MRRFRRVPDPEGEGSGDERGGVSCQEELDTVGEEVGGEGFVLVVAAVFGLGVVVVVAAAVYSALVTGCNP